MKFILIIGIIFSFSLGFGQEKCFPKTKNNQFVYDNGNVLSPNEERSLNRKLNEFTKRTSNVLVVVTTNDLCGTDKSQYAIEFGDQMGVGRDDKENGLVFLVKPKVGSAKGEVFISVGTGLQGAITDAGTRRIIDYEIIPYFKQGSYIGGITAGSETLMRLAEGEISESDYLKQDDIFWKVIFLLALFIFLIFLANKFGGDNDNWENYDRHGKHRGGRRRSSPWVIIGGGGGSLGGGGFGGGGFGGFGGGGFSGGGAGGSW